MPHHSELAPADPVVAALLTDLPRVADGLESR
jgi:hypothetical protein